MRDWYIEASRKLEDSKFSTAEREEISRELAGYLDELCSDARHRGLDESVAIQCALDELYQDARLGTKLRRARKENIMNDRTKGFWLPGLLSLVGSIVFFAIFEIAGLHPYRVGDFSSAVNHFRVTIFLPWLCILPFLGAASAYFSRRAGSGRTLRVVAGLLPVLGFLTGFVLVIPLVFAVNGMPGINAILPAVAAGTLSMVVLPGIALLLGVVPFLRSVDASRRAA